MENQLLIAAIIGGVVSIVGIFIGQLFLRGREKADQPGQDAGVVMPILRENIALSKQAIILEREKAGLEAKLEVAEAKLVVSEANRAAIAAQSATQSENARALTTDNGRLLGLVESQRVDIDGMPDKIIGLLTQKLKDDGYIVRQDALMDAKGIPVSERPVREPDEPEVKTIPPDLLKILKEKKAGEDDIATTTVKIPADTPVILTEDTDVIVKKE